MSDNDNPAPPGPTPNNTLPANVFGIGLMNAAISAQLGILLGSGIPATDVMNALIDHLSAVLALVEPEQLRTQIIGEIQRNLPRTVGLHVQRRQMTPGGILRPGPGTPQH